MDTARCFAAASVRLNWRAYSERLLVMCREFIEYFFFFFSSRRRHTRWNCDWSSDVCSSDLFCGPVTIELDTRVTKVFALRRALGNEVRTRGRMELSLDAFNAINYANIASIVEIGRASCRERV